MGGKQPGHCFSTFKIILTGCSHIFNSPDVFVCFRVRVQRAEDILEVCPAILTEDSMQAQHLAATLALYNLVKGQVNCAAVLFNTKFLLTF